MSDYASSIDQEALLSHVGWMRVLARQLVIDEHEADDLVQDTFVTALSA